MTGVGRKGVVFKIKAERNNNKKVYNNNNNNNHNVTVFRRVTCTYVIGRYAHSRTSGTLTFITLILYYYYYIILYSSRIKYNKHFIAP